MKTRSEVVAQFWQERGGIKPPQPAGFDPSLNAHVAYSGYTIAGVGHCTKCDGYKVAVKNGDGPLHYFPVGDVGCRGGRFCSFDDLPPE